MKKPFCLFLTVAAVCLSVIAYGQSPNPLYQHLSPSANHIYSVRLGQIIAKGELTGLLGSIPIKDPNAQKFINIIKDPASAGVDLNQEILITQTTASGRARVRGTRTRRTSAWSMATAASKSAMTPSRTG